MKSRISIFSILAAAAMVSPAVQQPLPLVPRPRSVVSTEGVYAPGVQSVENLSVARLSDPSIPPEGYRLSVTSNGVKVASSDDAGAFYARETLKQLAIVSGKGRDRTVSFPCCEIEDSPQYAWRGLLLDEGRHFFGKDAVRRLLDQMAQHKLNVFHWHLTEDQGWRIDVPGYPELVKYGSVRPESPAYDARIDWDVPADRRTMKMDASRYGPFYYTESDLRAIVRYAAERHIKVVPEIELPGHALASIAAYPELTCFPERMAARVPRCIWGVEKNMYCAGNDKAIEFLCNVLDFVCDVFPSETVHIGGDECPRDTWKACAKCQARIKAEGLRDEDELQAWFTERIAAHLAKRGRRIACWNGVLGCGRPLPGAVDMYGFEPRRAPLYGNADNPVVQCNQFHFYLDYGQGLADDPFPYIGNRVPLRSVHGYDIAANLPADQRSRLIGGQVCCWSEFTWNLWDLDWKTWPRACAAAEVFWTGSERGDYGDFLSRMRAHRRRLVAAGVNCAPLGE